MPRSRIVVLVSLLGLASGCATERAHQLDRSTAPSADVPPDRGDRLTARKDLQVAPVAEEVAVPSDGQNTEGRDAARRTLEADTRQHDLNAPVPSPTMIPEPVAEYPIDLSTALRLAAVENPTIAAARARVVEAVALRTQARVILAPSINFGSNFHLHTGNLQRSAGNVLNLTEQTLYFGGGAMATASGAPDVPMLNIVGTLTEAVFQPLAAHQRVIGSSFTALSTYNEILLDAAVLHLELLANQEILKMQRLSEKQVHDVAVTVTDFAVAGEHRTSDANRAQAEWKLHRAATQRAEEAVAVSAARLANRLNLDPTVRLRSEGETLNPLNLIALDTPTRDLIDYALRNRPDLRSRVAEVARAEVLYHQELARPWIPTFWVGYSAGAFGGGSNILPPLLAHVGGRADFDVRVFWTLTGMGAGNLALQKRGFARVGEADARRVATVNQVRRDIISARAEALAARQQIEITRRELNLAEQGFREDEDRSRQNIGRPIEVLNMLNLLAKARVNVIKALLRYNEAQFRLFVALGSPPPLVNPPKEKIAPPPLTTPLHGPLPVHGHPLRLGFS